MSRNIQLDMVVIPRVTMSFGMSPLDSTVTCLHFLQLFTCLHIIQTQTKSCGYTYGQGWRHSSHSRVIRTTFNSTVARRHTSALFTCLHIIQRRTTHTGMVGVTQVTLRVMTTSLDLTITHVHSFPFITRSHTIQTQRKGWDYTYRHCLGHADYSLGYDNALGLHDCVILYLQTTVQCTLTHDDVNSTTIPAGWDLPSHTNTHNRRGWAAYTVELRCGHSRRCPGRNFTPGLRVMSSLAPIPIHRSKSTFAHKDSH